MRLWSLHPKYLDAKGIVALWREALLAKHVLEGKTKGYKNHPQLERFKKAERPAEAINQYLSGIFEEAALRNYHFDKEKIDAVFTKQTLPVTKGQVAYEWEHLAKKLRTRDNRLSLENEKVRNIAIHPLFREVAGDIEHWETGAHH